MTKENEFEYYNAFRVNDDSIPLLASDTGNPRYLYENHFIKDPELMLFKLSKPIPKNPKMADYLMSDDAVISKKIFDVLEPLDIAGVQFLPARIKGKDDEVITDYWAVHAYNEIKCVDEKLSDCKIEISGLGYVKKIVLDKKILREIPLKERLIFRLKEDSAYVLFHASIVEKIMAVNPTGVKFTDIEKWNDGSYFEE